MAMTPSEPEITRREAFALSNAGSEEIPVCANVPNGNNPTLQGNVNKLASENATQVLPDATSFRGLIDGSDNFHDEPQLDAAILYAEYDSHRRSWWEPRRWFIYLFAALTPLFLIAGLLGLLTKNSVSNLFLIGAALTFVLLLLALAYAWFTLPRVVSFGRFYRRFVSIQLDSGGSVWVDPTVPVPDFPGLRDNFFALYRDSDELGTKIKPEDEEETGRKKRTLNELSHLIAPLKSTASMAATTPYIQADKTLVLDNLWLQSLDDKDIAEISQQTMPVPPQVGEIEPLELLTHEVEDYSSLDDALALGQEGIATIHNQIAAKVEGNLELVATEINRWYDHSEREKLFNQSLFSRCELVTVAAREGFAKVESAMEVEVRPAVQRLDAESAFYRSQVQRFYTTQTELLEANRDGILATLERQHQELGNGLEERLDEQRVLQAELKHLNDQRVQLDNSTNTRFENLKQLLTDLTERSYNLPTTLHFRSDYGVPPLVQESEEVLRLLTQLRADARLATSDVNDALNRYARLRFEPLDELGRLRQQIGSGTKWQSSQWLSNLSNFRNSGQLLAIAGEVGEAISVYLDFNKELERLNLQWCGLEVAIRELGASAYNNQLADAQRHLEGLETALSSLHSSLVMAPHSPEMSRPATFQNLYNLAAGLQRELDELGGLAGSIARTQERLSELEAELSQLEALISQNDEETQRVQGEVAAAIAELQRKHNLILARLEELKVERLQKIREHITAFIQTRDAEIEHLEVGLRSMQELCDISERFLQKHLRLSHRLFEEATSLRQNLETNISGIVREFERSVRGDRAVRHTSDMYVPAWYIQLSERPLWHKKSVGFANCYLAITKQETSKDSIWRFLFTNRPAVFFQLTEDSELEKLLQVNQMEYPAGEINILPHTLDWLVENDWISGWVTNLYRAKK